VRVSDLVFKTGCSGFVVEVWVCTGDVVYSCLRREVRTAAHNLHRRTEEGTIVLCLLQN
jgi:hypothetical protein